MRTITAAIALSIVATTSVWSGQISADHPDGILCPMPATQKRPEGFAVFYISAVLSDGQVLYQTLGNQVRSLTFDPSGSPLVELGESCQGKSLSELDAAGMTFGS